MFLHKATRDAYLEGLTEQLARYESTIQNLTRTKYRMPPGRQQDLVQERLDALVQHRESILSAIEDAQTTEL